MLSFVRNIRTTSLSTEYSTFLDDKYNILYTIGDGRNAKYIYLFIVVNL